MRELSLLHALVLAVLLRPGEDVKDCLVEVVWLVGENVMACPSDHLTKTNTQLIESISSSEMKL